MDLKKFPKKRIGEILIEEGFLSPQDLEKALKVQEKEGGLIGGVLVRLGLVSEENLASALSRQLAIPYIRLNHYYVNRDALKLIPKELAERYIFFPFEQGEGRISFAMVDPLNEEAFQAIEKRVPYRVQVFLTTVSEVREAIKAYYGEPVAQERGKG